MLSFWQLCVSIWPIVQLRFSRFSETPRRTPIPAYSSRVHSAKQHFYRYHNSVEQRTVAQSPIFRVPENPIIPAAAWSRGRERERERGRESTSGEKGKGKGTKRSNRTSRRSLHLRACTPGIKRETLLPPWRHNIVPDDISELLRRLNARYARGDRALTRK